MKITFFCRIKDKSALEHNLFYAQDLDILSKIDPELRIATKWKDISYRSDVIFVWWWTYAFIPVLIARILGKKIIITGTFNYDAPKSPNNYSSRPFWERALIWFSVKFASKNIFVSKREFEIFRDRLGFRNIVYIPHGVYVDNYLPNYNRTSNFLLTICWLEGPNLKRKCIYEIVDALVLLHEYGYDLRLIIAGRKGDAVVDLQNYIKKRQIQDNVKVLVDITEQSKIELLSTCKVYLQPSVYEGFGVAIAEAMSCGCAIVTSDAGEVTNVVGNGALVLKKTNSETISEAVVKLISDKRKYLSYQQNARKRVTQLFSVERRRSAIEKLLFSEHEKNG